MPRIWLLFSINVFNNSINYKIQYRNVHSYIYNTQFNIQSVLSCKVSNSMTSSLEKQIAAGLKTSWNDTDWQGCSLGLDVSVSRQSRDVVSKRLGLVETWEGLGLDLVSDWKSNVSVSYHRVSFTSQHAQMFASLQNCTYIVLNARRLYCLLIHKFTYLLQCKCISRCHLVRMYASAQTTLC